MSPEVIAICQQLIREGKTVSTGMLKSRLPGNTPYSEIIRAVQYCKQNPEAISEIKAPPKAQTVTAPLSDAERISQLENRIAAMEQRIAQLEQSH